MSYWHTGWGKQGKIAPDSRVLIGNAKGSAARAQAHRASKVPLTLPRTWGAPEPPPPAVETPPTVKTPRKPGSRWSHTVG